MSSIKKIVGSTGTSFKITVTHGRDLNGKQLRHYMTWTPPSDRSMTERQMQKAAEKAAFEFEQSIEQGFQLDNRQTFAEYAEYVLDLKERSGCKHRTIERYRELMKRIVPAIGHLKLSDIRPQHLNEFYKNLGEVGISLRDNNKAVAKTDLNALLKECSLSQKKAAELANLSASTVGLACRGKKIAYVTAEAIAQALGKDIFELFEFETCGSGQLSSKTVLEHHRLIRTILAQAEKEMLVPYNAASKAVPPKAERKDANYFQPEDLERILEALEDEPIKWRTITHLLMITGCRRGEIMGLKWDRVDFTNSQIKIDSNLLYSSKKGIYEDSPKTKGSERYIKLPGETMKLLKEYRQWFLELKLKNGDRWQNTGFCFVRDDGTPMFPDAITAWLRKFSMKHDLPHLNPHAFRHTMASVLINSGQDIVSVSKRLGHAQTSTTLNIYAHVVAEADAKSAECLADVILRPTKKMSG